MTQSGRSSLSMREYQVWASIQPVLTIQSKASSSFTTGTSIVRLCCGCSRLMTLTVTPLDPRRSVVRDVLPEERPALPTVRIALHRERAIADVRKDRGCDIAVVAEQVTFRDPLVRPVRLAEIGKTNDAFAQSDLARNGVLVHSESD
jgi:hypothetical protein